MKKIWNALRYGDKETRKCIGGVIFFSVIAVLLIIFSGLTGKFGIFILGMLTGVVAVILSQTFQLVDDSFVAEVDGEGTKDTVHAYSIKKFGVRSKNTDKEAKRDFKEDNNRDNLPSKTDMVHDEKEELPAQFDRYNQQFLKTVCKKYHVRKDHRAIIIDSSKSYRIKECPAFIWRVHNKVYILLLEKEPRKISVSRDMIRHMEYVPNLRADRSKEYISFQKDNLITSVFQGYLPDYFDSKAQNKNLKYKNLYKIYPDILLSNRSAATVMDLLCLNFMPDDKITRSDKLNGFFKRVYAAHIMYQDKVYSITEYKENIELILKEMCYADMPDREFNVTLENMVKGRMISTEYADYYCAMKKKVSGK